MKMQLQSIRFRVFHFLYKKIAKPFFFMFDPEFVHDTVTVLGTILGSNVLTRALIKFSCTYEDTVLEQNIGGLTFKNPVGLAAGFDKNGKLLNILSEVGFGFVEIGSVTGKPCVGNPKPRLWRLKQSQSLVVHYGLKNDGAEIVAKRLMSYRRRNVIGSSVAMTNIEENNVIENAIADYVSAYKAMQSVSDYITINISCPNTCGGQPFKEKNNLERLMTAMEPIRTAQPVFYKMSPDITREELDSIIDIARKFKISGFICTNLTKNRTNKKIFEAGVPDVGGISGKPVEELSERMISYIFKKTQKEFIIIACGGIFSAEDAYNRIKKGASLVQLITGMIFEGPQIIGDINFGIAELLKKGGYENISEAIGVDNTFA